MSARNRIINKSLTSYNTTFILGGMLCILTFRKDLSLQLYSFRIFSFMTVDMYIPDWFSTTIHSYKCWHMLLMPRIVNGRYSTRMMKYVFLSLFLSLTQIDKKNCLWHFCSCCIKELWFEKISFTQHYFNHNSLTNKYVVAVLPKHF